MPEIDVILSAIKDNDPSLVIVRHYVPEDATRAWIDCEFRHTKVKQYALAMVNNTEVTSFSTMHYMFWGTLRPENIPYLELIQNCAARNKIVKEKKDTKFTDFFKLNFTNFLFRPLAYIHILYQEMYLANLEKNIKKNLQKIDQFELGQTYRDIEKFDEAYNAFCKVSKSHEKYIDALYEAGCIAVHKLDKVEEAKNHFIMGLTIAKKQNNKEMEEQFNAMLSLVSAEPDDIISIAPDNDDNEINSTPNNQQVLDHQNPRQNYGMFVVTKVNYQKTEDEPSLLLSKSQWDDNAKNYYLFITKLAEYIVEYQNYAVVRENIYSQSNKRILSYQKLYAQLSIEKILSAKFKMSSDANFKIMLINAIALVKGHIDATLADHNKKYLSFFTTPDLVRAYRRALAVLSPDLVKNVDPIKIDSETFEIFNPDETMCNPRNMAPGYSQ